jgi:hypothetical protein
MFQEFIEKRMLVNGDIEQYIKKYFQKSKALPILLLYYMFIKNLTTDNIYLTVGLLTLIVLRTVGLRKVGLRLPNQPPPRLKKDNIYQCNLHADIFL